MRCETCKKNEASIFFQLVQGDQIATHAICEECASKMAGNTIQTIMSLVRAQGKPEKPAAKTAGAAAVCPACGTVVERDNPDQNMGCPECYRLFQQDAHIDEEPVSPSQRLREALASEDYETAAAIRDSLKKAGSAHGETI